jgi:hypothetical protein
MSPLLEDAQRVHDTAGLSDRMIAAATGAKPSTVRGWLAGRSEPTGARAERLIELAEMIKRLALVLRPAGRVPPAGGIEVAGVASALS